MARFRLMSRHYLNVPGTEWEQVEVDQKTGKQGRHRYKVHMYLDPEDPPSHPYAGPGREFIVTTKADPAYPFDIVFLGPPSTDMEPLDAEAEALLRRLPQGVAPMSEQAFPAVGPSIGAVAEQSEIAKFMAQMQGQIALLVGQNDRLAMELTELKAEREEPQFVDAPRPAQPEVRL